MKSYLICLVLIMVSYVGVTCGINTQVDPHSIFSFISSDFFLNKRKYASRISKSYQIYRGGVDVAFIGSSRSMRAFNGVEDFWPGSMVYNGALPNTSLKEINAVVDLLINYNRPKEVILGVEYDYFNYSHLVDEFHKSLFDNDTSLIEMYIEQAVSVYSTKESIELYRNLNLYNYDRPDLSMAEKFRILLENSARLAKKIPFPEHYPDNRWLLLDGIQEKLSQNNVKLTIVILPVHATLLLAYDELGLWGSYENWKVDLINNIKPSSKVVDYSGFNSYQIERIPLEEDSLQTMHWFTDPSHASSNYGRLVAEELAAKSEPKLGSLITKRNIANHIYSQRLEKEAYIAENPDTANFVSNLINRYRK